MTVLDQTNDLTGVETHRLTSIYAPPNFVKQASHNQLHGDRETLPVQQYADPLGKQYPMHTPAATWLSAVYLVDKRAHFHGTKFDRIRATLQERGRVFGIAPELQAIEEQYAKLGGDRTRQLPDDAFMLVWTAEGEAKQRHYPLRNALEVKTAAEWLVKFRDDFNFQDRHTMARRVLAKADEFGAGISDTETLDKMAGFGSSRSEDVVRQLQARVTMTPIKHAEFANQLLKVAEALAQLPLEVRDQGRRCELAALLNDYDVAVGLRAKYAEGLARPEDVLFEFTEKAAADVANDHVATTTGSIYEKSALAEIPLSEIQAWLGTEVAEHVSTGGFYLDPAKLATALATFPRDTAQLFDRMAAQLGLVKVATDSSAAAPVTAILGDAELAELAATYQPLANQGL